MYKLIDYVLNMSLYATNSESSNLLHGSATASSLLPQQGLDIAAKRHAKYFKRFLELLPGSLASHDSTRVTIAFFAVCGLDVLNALDSVSETMKQNIIDWVYSHQVVPKDGATACGGFQGSSTLNVKGSDPNDCGTNDYKWGHLAMTYTGIAILVTLGDDLSRLNRKAIIEGVAAVQKADGNFSASIEGNEHDMRFVYCAAAICTMLDDWGTVDKQAMANYIKNSLRYDCGVSQHYEMESHGGTTFCALAALQLSGQLEQTLNAKTVERLKRWLIFRQVDGFNGRPNKPVDTCYSFWIGSTLKILDVFQLTDFERNRSYLMSTEDPIIGGFSKWPGFNTDPFHTYFSLCGLSFLNEPGLAVVMPSLNITERAHQRLNELHRLWKLNSAIRDVRLNVE